MIKRRIQFLLDEAKYGIRNKNGEIIKDQVITYALRVLSNHASVGKDMSSNGIKKLNQRISEGALKRLSLVESFNQWTKITINEHPEPINTTWLWITKIPIL